MLEKISKIPIRIDPFFWLVVIFIGFLNSADFDTLNEKIVSTLIWGIIILFSVIIHEYGHAITAIFFGQQAKIELIGIGGVTQRSGKKLRLWQEFLIVLNGPLCSILIAVCVSLLVPIVRSNHPMINYWLVAVIEANIFWTIINLIPVQPLDGGRILSIVFEALFGIKGIKIALFLSIIIAGIIGVLFFLKQFVIGGILFFMLAFESYRTWKATLSLTENDQLQPLQEKLHAAELFIKQGEVDLAANTLEEIRSEAKQGLIYITASQYIAEIFYQKGLYKEAFQILYPIREKLDYRSLLLLQRLAHHNDEWAAAIDQGTRAYQLVPDYETALLNAIACAHLDNVSPAVGWIECAIRDGMPNPASVLNKQEFDPIRNTPQFQELVSKINH